jgi:hypothetical protein
MRGGARERLGELIMLGDDGGDLLLGLGQLLLGLGQLVTGTRQFGLGRADVAHRDE